MKNTDIESLLRENKPQVHENPTFLLEVQQKMRAVDGIKSEVDRQRRYGHQAIVIALCAGLILGSMVAAVMSDMKMVLEPWKPYILLFVAACAIALGTIYSKRKENIAGL